MSEGKPTLYCPDCDTLLPTICFACLMCQECRKIFTKDHIQEYMEKRLEKLKKEKREKEFGIID